MEIKYFMTAEQKEKFDRSQSHGHEVWEQIPEGNRKLLRTFEHGIYTTNVFQIPMGKGHWEYLFVQILKEGNIIAEFIRNYAGGVFEIFHHRNGNDYMFTGHDYQGYTVINLTQETMGIYVHDGFENGWGWCTAGIDDYDEEKAELRVDGCYWACPYEIRVLDFSNPDILPLPVLQELDHEGNPYPEEEEADGTVGTEGDTGGQS